ncbi:MAG: TraR/DksA C4-type zinc finger protein [Acetobacterales bacterium]
MPDDTDIARLKQVLLNERRTLTADDAAHAQDRSPVELDQTRQGRLSRIDAVQQQEMAKAVHARTEARLRQIDAALQRIDDGDYGCCLSCGEEIASRRIEADPATPRCIDCASGRRR